LTATHTDAHTHTHTHTHSHTSGYLLLKVAKHIFAIPVCVGVLVGVSMDLWHMCGWHSLSFSNSPSLSLPQDPHTHTRTRTLTHTYAPDS